MRLQTILKSICSIAITAVVALIPFCSVTALETEQDTEQNEIEYIRLVSEPDNVTDDVYYVMNGKKSDPSSFTWVDNGISGKALQLDGITQHIRLATARVKELSSFTFSAWVNWAGNDGEKEQRILCAYKNDNHSLILSPHNIDPSQQLNGIQLTMEDPQLEPVSLHHRVNETVTSALETNQWHHVAVTLSDEVVALYIDGILYASQMLENFSVDTMDLYRLVIGSEFEGDAQFNGLIDSAFLFTTALNAEQVALVSQNKKPIPGAKPTTQQEVLATKPYVYDDTPAEEKPVRILGLSPLLFAILGGCVVLIIVLSLLLSLYRKKNQKWPEEDHL